MWSQRNPKNGMLPGVDEVLYVPKNMENLSHFMVALQEFDSKSLYQWYIIQDLCSNILI